MPVIVVLRVELYDLPAVGAGSDDALEELSGLRRSMLGLVGTTLQTDAHVEKRRHAAVASDDSAASTHRSDRNMVKIWEGYHRKPVAPSPPAGVAALVVSATNCQLKD